MRENTDNSNHNDGQQQIEQLQATIRHLREALAARDSGISEQRPRFHRQIDVSLFETAPFSSLSPRERQVLIAYIATRDSKAVAGELGSKLQTVKNQLASIRDKLGVECREDLIVFVLTAGHEADAGA
jgi:DNA-binding NarL/FixJ family response regulator